MNRLLTLIFTALMIFSGIGSTAYSREYPVTSGRPVEKQADTLFEMINKELQVTSKVKEKFKSIQNVLVRMKGLLSSSSNVATAEQAEYVEQYIVALQSLPQSKNFKKTKCNSYEVDEKAKTLLDQLCSAN